MLPPTCEQIFNEDEDLEVVSEETVGNWRWGHVEECILHRKSDDSFWSCSYRVGSQGETHDLRDGDADIGQVEPTIVVTTKYRPAADRPPTQTTSLYVEAESVLAEILEESLDLQFEPGSYKLTAILEPENPDDN